MDQLHIVQNQAGILPLEKTTEDADLQTIQTLVFDPLVRWEKGRLLPGLADSWEVSADGRIWHFHLREDAHFSDGSPCTVEDVLYTIELLRVSSDEWNMPGPYAPYFQALIVHPIGKYDLRIHSIEPNGDVAEILSEVFIRKNDSQGRPILGTGAYKIVEYENNRLVRLSARNGEPYSQITFESIPDADARFEALKTGHADIALNLEQISVPMENSGFRWGRIGNMLTVPIFLNGFSAPFNQPEARLAVNLAIDVPRIIRDVWSGLAFPAASVVSPYHFGFPQTLKPISHNPSLAKELLSRVDMPSELVLRTPLVIPDRALQVCKMVQYQLGKIDLNIKIDVVEDRPLFAREVGARQIGHMAIFDSSPHSTYRILREKISSRNKGMWWQGVIDEKADRLISEAHESCQPDARKKAYEKVLTYLNEAPPWLYLYHPISVYAYREELSSFEVNHIGRLHFPECERITLV